MNTISFKERQKLFQQAAQRNSLLSKGNINSDINRAKTKKLSNNDLINTLANNSSNKLENKKRFIDLKENINNEGQNIENNISKNLTMRNSVHIMKKKMEEMIKEKEKNKNVIMIKNEKKEINQNKIINKLPEENKKENSNLNEEINKINENKKLESNKEIKIIDNNFKNEQRKNSNENKIEEIKSNENKNEKVQEENLIINEIIKENKNEIKEEEKLIDINEDDEDSSISSYKKEFNEQIINIKNENNIINKIKINIDNNNNSNNIKEKIEIKNNSVNNIKIEKKNLADLDIDNFKDFKEEYYLNRKYDKKNYDKGKIFFKYRYLKNKYTQINETIRRLTSTKKQSSNKGININNDNNDDEEHEINTSNNQLERYSKINTINKKFILSNNVYLSFFIENPSSKCKNSIDKDSELRHYHSQFLKLTENSILYFNLKQYEESYQCLYVNGIIKNLEEFGEFLLVGNGFDKFIIGEFISKKEGPNEKKEVLKGFINGIKMDYEEINFLECFRFFMKRFYLPKDANLILEIMDSFCQKYFDINKSNEEFINIFNSSNNIYLLISTLLAVNTMFTRKDIKNINKISKEDFVNMNKEIQEQFLKDLYDDLKNKPLLIAAENYNENVYKRMSTLIKENTLRKKNKNNSNDLKNNNMNLIINKFDSNDENEIINDLFLVEIHDNNNEDLNLTNNLFSFNEEDKQILKKVQKFHKFVGENFIHVREFLVHDDYKKLIWGKNIETKKDKGKYHFLLISDISDVYNGIEHSDILKKFVKENPKELKEKDHYITIITKKKEINLKSNSLQTALLWYRALKSLVVKVNKESLEKNSKIVNELHTKYKLKIEELWKKFILPNWNIYGKYILEKLKKRNQIKKDKLPSLLNIKNIITIVKEIADNKILEYFDFFRFFRIGLPPFCRGKIWKILIGNSCSITETLYENYLVRIQKVDFKECENKYREDNKSIFNVEYNINQMIIDVIKEKEKFNDEMIKLKINKEQIMIKCYNVLRVFYLMRSDLIYKKSIISLIYAFLIVEDNEFNTFSKIYNLICNNDIIKFYIDDEEYITKAINFFGDLVKTKLPRIHRHFKNLGISYDLFFISWITELFSSSLDLKLWLRIIDLYLIDGEYILYQTGIAILAIQEDNLLDLTIIDILNLIKRLPSKYELKTILQKMKDYEEIMDEYVQWKIKDEIGTQKLQLFETIFNEEG